MKFYELKLNQSFSYRGETFVKTGPLLGTSIESGKKVFIPRHTEILADEGGLDSPVIEKNRLLDAGSVYQAVQTFYQECLNTLDQAEIPEQRIDEIRNRIQQAYLSLITQCEQDK